MRQLLLIKYGELTTKKDNRNTFINILCDNIHKSLNGLNFKIIKNNKIVKKSTLVNFNEKDVFYIKPTLKCTVTYTEKTKNNTLRHPVYKTLKSWITLSAFYFSIKNLTNVSGVEFP